MGVYPCISSIKGDHRSPLRSLPPLVSLPSISARCDGPDKVRSERVHQEEGYSETSQET